MTPDAETLAVARRPRRGWLVRLGLLTLAVAVAVVVIRIVGRIDWAAVRAALALLQWWQPIVLLGVVVVRQVLNGLPLAFYIRGVSVVQSTLNDLGAILMSAIAPPPSDLALRVAMFRSWGVPAAKGVAGTVMNTLTFYIIRFSAPALGFVLLAIAGRPAGIRWAELISIAIAVSITVGIFLVLHSEGLARTVGRRSGRLVRRVRRSVDPEAWAEACSGFRADIAATFRSGFPRSLLAMAGMLAVDFAVLLLCLRFVGLSASEVSMVDVAIAYLFAYPFTLFPFSGIGLVDALIVAGLVEAGGLEVEAAAVAGLVVWRVFTVGIPVLMGAGALGIWRRGLQPGIEADASAEP